VTRESTARSGSAPADPRRWAVVIPSFNHGDDVITCLASLRDAVNAPETVILVDDASTDDSLARVRAWADAHSVTHATMDDAAAETAQANTWLTVVASRANAGFSVSCNRGIRLALRRPDVSAVLLLNNDAAVSSSYFVDLAEGIKGHERLGLVTGTIYEWDRETVWYAGGRFNPLRAVAEHRLRIPNTPAPRPTQFVCGCTMLITRDAVDAAGLIPECYSPCYCEDADYSIAVARAGFELLYVPAAVAYHHVGRSLGRARQSPQVIYWATRNRGYMLRRNYSGLEKAGGVLYLVVTKPLRALWEVLHGRPKSGQAFLRGTIAGLAGPLERD